jgi:hypothetical protein
VYIIALSPSKWDHWREDCVIMQADVHKQLELPTAALTGHRSDWERS